VVDRRRLSLARALLIRGKQAAALELPEGAGNRQRRIEADCRDQPRIALEDRLDLLGDVAADAPLAVSRALGPPGIEPDRPGLEGHQPADERRLSTADRRLSTPASSLATRSARPRTSSSRYAAVSADADCRPSARRPSSANSSRASVEVSFLARSRTAIGPSGRGRAGEQDTVFLLQ